MSCVKAIISTLGVSFGVFALTIAPASHAQVNAPGFVAKPALVSTISGVESKEIAIINVSMEPEASSPHHTHPGDCYGTIIEGTVELVVEGQPPRSFAAGESWHNPQGNVHYFRNIGKSPARLVNTLIVDKGKPRTNIVPTPQK